jgi:hypothetical protein
MPQFLDIMRRLLMPEYEEARQYWSQAHREGFFDGASESTDPVTLHEIIETFGPEYVTSPDSQEDEEQFE